MSDRWGGSQEELRVCVSPSSPCSSGSMISHVELDVGRSEGWEPELLVRLDRVRKPNLKV